MEEISTYSVGEFSEYLAKHFDQEVVSAFEKNKISGSLFLRLSESQIGRMVEAIGDVVELQTLQYKILEAEVTTYCSYFLW